MKFSVILNPKGPMQISRPSRARKLSIMGKGFYFNRHPIFANVIIILMVAVLGFFIIYFSLNIFTKHGRSATVPEVEKMTYTNAIEILHDNGFKTDIRDSIYNEELPPGMVIEQFPKPGMKVKPGRKIFLYINAVHPRQVIIDTDDSSHGLAMRGYSLRQVTSKLEELGFKNVKVVELPGDDDRVIRLLANGKPITKMQKVPVNAVITVEVHNGAMSRIRDSILNAEFLEYVNENPEEFQNDYDFSGYEEMPRSTSEKSQIQEVEPEAPAEPTQPEPTPEPEPAEE